MARKIKFGITSRLNKTLTVPPPITLTVSFDTGWEDVPPMPTWNPPDYALTVSFDTGWEDVPPMPTWNPPDYALSASFDSDWDDI